MARIAPRMGARLTRWLIAGLFSVCAFAITWWVLSSNGAEADTALALAAVPFSLAAMPLAWWAGREIAAPRSEPGVMAGVIVGEIPRAAPGYQSRSRYLDALVTAASVGQPSVWVLIGPPGIGKTQMAAAFARARVAGGWPVVAWINAEDQRGIVAGLADLSGRLGLTSLDERLTAQARRAMRSLEELARPSLVVFDNVVDVAHVVQWLPAVGPVCVVMTSTKQTVGNVGVAIPVSPLATDEAVLLFEQQTSITDTLGARRLAAALGFLPLALSQAAAVIRSQGLTYGQYLGRLDRYPLEEYLGAAPADPYPRSAVQAVLLSVDVVEASDPTGVHRQLIELFSVLPGVGVRRAVLTGYIEAQHDHTQVGAAVAALAECSLINVSVNGDTITMHQFIQRVIRDRLERAGRLQAVRKESRWLLDGIQRRAVQVLTGVQVLSGFGLGVSVAVSGVLAVTMAGSLAAAGVMAMATSIGAMVFSVPLSRLMHARGRRFGLVFGYLCGALGAIIVSAAVIAEVFSMAVIGGLLYGAVSAAVFQARYASVDLAPAERRGRSLAWVVWGTTGGAIFAPTLLPLIGWASRPLLSELASAYLLAAVMFLAAAGLVWKYLRPDPLLTAREWQMHDARLENRRRLPTEITRVVAASPGARLGLAGSVIGHFVMVSTMTMAPVLIWHQHSQNVTTSLASVGLLASLHVAAMYGLSPAMGWMSDTIGRRFVLAIGAVLAGVGLAGIAVSAGAQLALIASMVAIGLGWSATMVAGSTLLAESVPTELRALTQGLSDATIGFAGVAGAGLSGVLFEAGGSHWVAIVSAVAVVGLAATISISRRTAIPSANGIDD